MTRKRLVNGRMTTLSRIDRWYVSFMQIDMLDSDIAVRVMGIVVDGSLSDDIPVQLVMGTRRARPTGGLPIQRWVTEQPSFSVWVERLVQALLPDGLMVFEEHSAMATSLPRAASEVWAEVLAVGARTPEEQAHWAMVAMRAWRAGDVAGTRRAARSTGALGACWSERFVGHGQSSLVACTSGRALA